MISNLNIVDGGQNRQVFFANGVNSFHTWIKPPNCKFVHFFLLGGGGGGGGGQSGAQGTSRRSGAGGGSSGVTNGLIPASFIPDILYIQVGSGGGNGIGGTTNSNGGAGTLSYVMVAPDTGKTISNVFLQSGSAGAGGGASGVNGGAAGTAGSIWNLTTAILFEFALVPVFTGLAGTLGPTTATPGSITLSGITTPGAAGAGIVFAAQAGGSIIAGGNIPTMSGGTAGGSSSSTTPGGNGSGGYMSFNPNTAGYTTQPLVFLGGAGGGSSDGGPGGQGGNGAYGCGGGGGGAGITNQGGNGGRGGDGIVIITYW